jgi:excisionase family DNA binding protein
VDVRPSPSARLPTWLTWLTMADELADWLPRPRTLRGRLTRHSRAARGERPRGRARAFVSAAGGIERHDWVGREPGVSDAWTSERTGRAQSTGPAPRNPAGQETTMSPSTPAPPTRLLPVAQAAEQLSTTASTLYELAASHAVPSVRIGRAIRIPAAALHRLQNEPAEYLAQPDRAADRRSISTAQQRPTSDVGPMPDHRHGEQQASEPRQPNSCETRDPDTDLHPRATRRRVDAKRPREAQS